MGEPKRAHLALPAAPGGPLPRRPQAPRRRRGLQPERARRLEGGTFASYLAGVLGIRAVDEQTVELDTDGPVTVLLNKLALVHIVPEGYSGGSGPSVGTGPYRLSAPAGGEGILLQAFGDYWGPPPATPEVHLVPVLDPGERRRQLFSDEVDVLIATSTKSIWAGGW